MIFLNECKKLYKRENKLVLILSSYIFNVTLSTMKKQTAFLKYENA